MEQQRTTIHVPVLLQQVIDVLAPEAGQCVIDCTLGGGGHAEALLAQLGPSGRYVGVDTDLHAIERVRARLQNDARLITVVGNFRSLESLVRAAGVSTADRILFDLGLSSDQLEVEGRGFSFIRDEPLVMTLDAVPDPEALTAWHVVNEWSETSLADVIYGFGGETRARKIAKAIVDARVEAPINSTAQLADIVSHAYGRYRSKVHPATKTFQAIRMAVNDELGSLEAGLAQAYDLLSEGGRVAVISFHSLEDGAVKRTFRAWQADGKGTIITKKPMIGDRLEVLANPRARSAKLRCFEKRAPDR
ncbi:MAG: 16S rRNA (cytosine(1402)-N(4))-methyltransferase RsmH [Candidatus Pacebacteria bacterium]|nr:16S rRNA (cytosine(1402)-N(4))-methyltransferase RsmH [Candidatus Paceibacterota bacterium]